jgi:hypothetical protein
MVLVVGHMAMPPAKEFLENEEDQYSHDNQK